MPVLGSNTSSFGICMSENRTLKLDYLSPRKLLVSVFYNEGTASKLVREAINGVEFSPFAESLYTRRISEDMVGPINFRVALTLFQV